MTKVRFLHLHTECFHAGKNFQTKIVTAAISGLKLEWDEKHSWFEITYDNGKDGPRTGYIFANNAAFWEPEQGEAVELPKNEHKTSSVEGRRKAQVSTPMGHVFEGPGAGKVRQ